MLAAVTQLGEVLEVFNLKDSTHVVRIGPHGEPEFKISQVMVFLRVSWDLAMSKWQTVLSMRFSWALF